MGISYWNVSDFKMKYKNGMGRDDVWIELDPTFVAPTPFNFSFHCSEPPPVRSANLTTSDVSVVFLGLQACCCTCCIESFFTSNDEVTFVFKKFTVTHSARVSCISIALIVKNVMMIVAVEFV